MCDEETVDDRRAAEIVQLIEVQFALLQDACPHRGMDGPDALCFYNNYISSDDICCIGECPLLNCQSPHTLEA